ncbi:hypothetical protein [Flammeovirga aprica]|uniref:Uncharacterized protein n=1 Tax=Flammeovirga aprica JL-4 TaxID=694437 RepID=A0A7X9S0S3_9BACT|nr:hypothetical protein [Flammeovirga aprica]NME72332.1 hypothetical protein [Flammeovirga aprica JL-4]
MKKRIIIPMPLLLSFFVLKNKFIDSDNSLIYNYCFNRLVYIPDETNAILYNDNVVSTLKFITKRLKIDKEELIQGYSTR